MTNLKNKMQENIIEEVRKESKDILKSIIKQTPWFWDKHIELVVDISNKLCDFYPEIDREVCILAVYMHDVGRSVDDSKHAVLALPIIEEMLNKYNYPKGKTDKVKNAVRSHRCRDVMPDTEEGKVLASADAISHLIGNFYFRLMYILAKREEFEKVIERIREKVDRDFNKKIFFKEGKEMVKEKYEAWVELLEE